MQCYYLSYKLQYLLLLGIISSIFISIRHCWHLITYLPQYTPFYSNHPSILSGLQSLLRLLCILYYCRQRKRGHMNQLLPFLSQRCISHSWMGHQLSPWLSPLLLLTGFSFRPLERENEKGWQSFWSRYSMAFSTFSSSSVPVSPRRVIWHSKPLGCT